MSSLVLTGDTSGTVTVAAPAVAGSNTLTLLAATATNSVNTLGTAVASTSGTSIDFTGLPSWIKRITLIMRGVSVSGTSDFLVQLGAGSVLTSGYLSSSEIGGVGATSTIGFLARSGVAANTYSGHFTITNISSTAWVYSSLIRQQNAAGGTGSVGAGDVSLGGTLDRLRLTTVNGTDTFDAGSVNILYEG